MQMRTFSEEFQSAVGVLSAAVSFVLVILVVFAPRAFAADGYAFDPALSLTGSCAVSTEDEIPDPGPCPGGPGDHPALPFEEPCGVAVDRFGDIYVSSPEISSGQGKIDVFGPDGDYLTSIELEDEAQPCSLAVDSLGNLYARVVQPHGEEASSTFEVLLFKPEAFPPVKGSTYEAPTLIVEEDGGFPPERPRSVAVDPSNDHVYVAMEDRVAEFDSATAGSGVVTADIGEGLGTNFTGVSVLGKNHDVYVSGTETDEFVSEEEAAANQRVFLFDGVTHAVQCEAKGSETASGSFGFRFGAAQLAVNQLSGDFLVADVPGHGVVDRFDDACKFVGELPRPPALKTGNFGQANPSNSLAVDAPGEAGEPGYQSPNEGEVYVTSGAPVAKSHLFAYRATSTCPPEVSGQQATAITETEAVLRARLNPCGLDTHYHFEYLSEAAYLANGKSFSGPEAAASAPVPDADGGAGGTATGVSQAISGLLPGTTYRFRLVAENEECPPGDPTAGEGVPCGKGADARFATFPGDLPVGPCSNEALRSGPSSRLPDCRAYELVTPADTGGHIPTMTELGSFSSSLFPTQLGSPDGSSLAFGIEGGTLPGLGGGGYHDTFAATREEGAGWVTHLIGFSGAEAGVPEPGGISPDHGYAFWLVDPGPGSLPPGAYLRTPGGAEPIGVGSLGTDLNAVGRWIGDDGTHIVFDSAAHLEKATPTAGNAIYERAFGQGTEVISLKPDGSAFGSGESATFEGVSPDGRGVAFRVGETLYVRRNGEQTVAAAEGEVLFGGLSEGGRRLAYMVESEAPVGDEPPHGEIFVCDLAEGPCAGPGSHPPTRVGTGAKSILANISADGSHVYFVSTLSQGGKGTPGAQNLFVWDGASVRLIATVTVRDVVGEPGKACSNCPVDGMGLWVMGPAKRTKNRTSGPGTDSSRTTPDGSVAVFESRANLTAFDSDGHAEIYRYDSNADPGHRLACVSCDPTGAAPTSDAELESVPTGKFEAQLPPLNSLAQVDNLSRDGKRVFFQSADRLVSRDVDGKIDVYEWEAQGGGGCDREAGCIHLISSGNSADDDYLYATTPDGSNVFFETGDTLLPQDLDHTPSIYDARIGGGFPASPPPSVECIGEACQPSVTSPERPSLATAIARPGSSKGRRRACPRGRHLVHRNGKARCARKQKSHHKPRGKR